MCGRFTLTATPDAVQMAFDLNSVPHGLTSRYNIAPSQPIAVITNDDPSTLTFHQWGLLPSWAKDPKLAFKLINARSETAHEKPSFRAAFKRRRCLIPTDGFFEWQKVGTNKIPHFIHFQERRVFAFGGLWEIWQSPDGSEVRSCTILTTEANSFMEPLHHRMPVIIKPEDYETWLSPGDMLTEEIKPMLRPYAPDEMIEYPVSTLVNSAQNDVPSVIEPVA